MINHLFFIMKKLNGKFLNIIFIYFSFTVLFCFVLFRIYSNNRKEQEGESSWWNNVGTMIGNMFIGDEDKRRAMRFPILLINF